MTIRLLCTALSYRRWLGDFDHQQKQNFCSFSATTFSPPQLAAPGSDSSFLPVRSFACTSWKSYEVLNVSSANCDLLGSASSHHRFALLVVLQASGHNVQVSEPQPRPLVAISAARLIRERLCFLPAETSNHQTNLDIQRRRNRTSVPTERCAACI